VASRRCSCDFERSIRALRIGDIEYREISAITRARVPGTGHTVYFEKPEEIASIAFWRGTATYRM